MKKLKVIMMTLMMCLVSVMSFSQDNATVDPLFFHSEKIVLDDFYQDKDNYLIYSVTDTFDTIQRAILIDKIKNWASLNFVNMNEVLVSETQTQLVFNYINNTFYQKSLLGKLYRSWYYRLVIQMKDDRVKISIYDDGNAYWAGSYSQYGSVSATSARIYTFRSLAFKKNGYSRGSDPKPLLKVKQNCIDKATSIIKAIRTQENPTNVKEETW